VPPAEIETTMSAGKIELLRMFGPDVKIVKT
jgi:hypothetical protein